LNITKTCATGMLNKGRKMKARQVEVYGDQGNLEKIEVTLETGEHLFDTIWDPIDAQSEENRIAFRQWTKRMVSQKGHELT